jgi:hypothetical protein
VQEDYKTKKYMKNPTRTIKFTAKKCVMRPFEGEEGLVETWEVTDTPICKEFFHYRGNKYKLISSVDKNQKN